MFAIVVLLFFLAAILAFVEWWKGPDIPTS
jgi:hypothetical protein